MKLMLDKYTIRAIAEEVVKVMEDRKKPKLVTTDQAAKMLGISARRVRELKNKLGYVKAGDNMQGRLMFDANTLQERYRRFS